MGPENQKSNCTHPAPGRMKGAHVLAARYLDGGISDLCATAWGGGRKKMKRRQWGEGQEQMLPDLKKRFGKGVVERIKQKRRGQGEPEEEQRYGGDWRLCHGEAIKETWSPG